MPTWYDIIKDKPGVTGIKGFSQSVALREYKLYDVSAFCLGLCVHWLIDKKTNGYKSLKIFDEPESSTVNEKSSLLSSKHRYTRISQEEQITYYASKGGLNISTAISTLGKSNLTECVKEEISGDSFATDALKIGEQVSGADSKYFLLIASGNGAHAFGIVRNGSAGESRDFRVFDPNAGEFEVTGQVGILAILVWLKKFMYPEKLGDSYTLYAFKG